MLILLPILLCHLSDKTSIVLPAVDFSLLLFFSYYNTFLSLLLMPYVKAVGLVVIVFLSLFLSSCLCDSVPNMHTAYLSFSESLVETDLTMNTTATVSDPLTIRYKVTVDILSPSSCRRGSLNPQCCPQGCCIRR